MGELAPADDLLIARIAEGDREAFAELYRRHRADICRFAAHMCGSTAAAEDVVHEAFVAVIDSASRYRPGHEPEIVKGAPYSAEVINESVQTLSDGNRIVHQSTSRVFRDAEGRTRREEDRASGSPAITISDPVAGSFWTLDVDARIARQAPTIPLVFGGTLNRNSELERLRVVIDGQLVVGRTDWSSGFVRAGNEQHAEERLTARTIEGLRVEGLRRTTTIPAGAVGNERPIVVTSDEWTSPELKVLVLSESSDPRSGTSTYKLVNVRRGDPPASLFQVPADYTTVQAPRPFVASPPGRGEGRGEGRGGRSGPPPR